MEFTFIFSDRKTYQWNLHVINPTLYNGLPVRRWNLRMRPRANALV